MEIDDMMSERNKNCLKANYEDLVNDMNCKPILHSLHAKGLIDPALESEITNIATHLERNQRFLSWLRTAPGAAYYVFKNMLEQTKQGHLSKLLRTWEETTQLPKERDSGMTYTTNTGGFMSLKINIVNATSDKCPPCSLIHEVEENIWSLVMSILYERSYSGKLKADLPDQDFGDILQLIRHISACNRVIVHVSTHPVTLVVLCPTIPAVRDLLFTVEKGAMSHLCQSVLATERLKERLKLKTLQLSVTTDKNECLFCVRQLMAIEGVVTVKITINSDNLPGFDSANIEDFLCNMLQECSTEGARRMCETLQEHGRKVVSIIPGCILVTLMCPTLYSLRDLKEKCESGHLAQLCETALLANGFGLKDLSLHAEISEWDYKLCQAEIEDNTTDAMGYETEHPDAEDKVTEHSQRFELPGSQEGQLARMKVRQSLSKSEPAAEHRPTSSDVELSQSRRAEASGGSSIGHNKSINIAYRMPQIAGEDNRASTKDPPRVPFHRLSELLPTFMNPPLEASSIRRETTTSRVMASSKADNDNATIVSEAASNSQQCQIKD